MPANHTYQLEVIWTGNTGNGTASYKAYERSLEIHAQGKATLKGSSDPQFRGDSSKWNPEELLLAAISACHMLSYLHQCVDNGIVVETYQDAAKGEMRLEKDGSGKFIHAELHPQITISNPQDIEKAKKLHENAHHNCFIANSVNFPIAIDPVIEARKESVKAFE